MVDTPSELCKPALSSRVLHVADAMHRGIGDVSGISLRSAPTAPEVQKMRAEFIEGYNLNMATPWIAAKLLRDKQISRVQRKHASTPI